MIKKYLLFLFVLLCFKLSSQTTQDTMNYPYYTEMMQDKTINFYVTQRAFNLYWTNREITKGSGWKPFKRWEWMAQQIIDSAGNFPDDEEVFRKLISLKNISEDDDYKGKKMRTLSATCSNQGNWKEFGPRFLPINATGQINGMGRLNAVAVHPTDSNIIFAGACAGGLWKTTNGGQTWDVQSDSFPTLGVSSIAFNPKNPNTVYIGTGDRDAGDAAGFGVFKSVNGGKSWVQITSGMSNRIVGRLIVSTTDTNVILAATNNGIYRSTNGGSSWTQVLSGGHFKDIIFKPNNHNIVYATRDGILFRSTNNGVAWSSITAGLPTSGMSRGVIDVNSNLPDLVYFWLANGSVNRGFYLSRDSGTTFSTQSTTPNLHDYSTNGSGGGGQAWYDKDMVTDPLNPAIILVGGVNIFRSSDTGKTWTIAGYWVNEVHADQHELIKDPLTKRIYVANDGGLYYTRNRGVTWIPIKTGLGIAQIYKMDVSRTQKDILINGYQDNGTGNYNGSNWYTSRGGDGMDCEIDQTDNKYSYGELYYGSIFRVQGVQTTATIAANGTNGITESGDWVTPFSLREGFGTTMYIGYKNIWRSTNIRNSPPTWTVISNNLGGTNSVNFRETESSIGNSDIFYASKSNGTFFRSDDINATTPSWTTITQPVSGTVNAIETDPKMPNTVYIGINNRVYRSLNKGTNWTQIHVNLPANVSCILLDTSSLVKGIYVGTSGGGVWYTDTTLSVWKFFSKGLPHTVRVTDLKMYYAADKECNSNILYGSTYNRGNFFTTVYPDITKKPKARLANHELNTTFCKNASAEFKDNSCNWPTKYQWKFSPNNINFVSGDSNSANIKITFNASGKYQYLYIVSNCNGADTVAGEIDVNDSINNSYCTPSNNTFNNIGLGIYNVQFSNINHSSEGRNPEGSYVNNSCNKVAEVIRGKKYQIKIKTGAVNNERVIVFIDFNNDGDFNDAGEMVSNPAAALQFHSDSILIPLTAPLNKILRMRVRSDFSNVTTNPCSNLSYGQTEDYGIVIRTDEIKPKFVVSRDSVCQSQTVTFTDSTEGFALNYKWYFGAGASIDSAVGKGPFNITYKTPGFKKIKLITDGFIYENDSVVYVINGPKMGIIIKDNISQLCSGLPILLSSIDSNNSAANFQWRKNNSNILDSISSTLSYQNSTMGDSGLYTIFASKLGCKDSVSMFVNIYPNPNVLMNLSYNQSCLKGNLLTMTDNSTIDIGNTTTSFKLSDNSSYTNSVSNHKFTNEGTFSIKLISTSNKGCKDSTQQNVTIHPQVSIGFNINNDSQCFKGHQFDFSNSSSISSGTFLNNWYFSNNDSIKNQTNANYTFSSYNMNNQVTLTTISNQNCKDTLVKNLTLLPNPIANFNTNDSEQCFNHHLFSFNNLSNIISGTFINNWSFGDGQFSSNTNPTHQYLNSNNFDVKLITQSNFNCLDSIIKKVIVNPNPIAKFSVNDSTQCLTNNNFVFNNLSTLSTGTLSSEWNLSDATQYTSNNLNKSFANVGNYNAQLIVNSDKNCFDTIQKPLEVFENSVPDFNINSPTQCFKNNQFNFTNFTNLNFGTLSYTWQFGDNTQSTSIHSSKIYSTVFDSLSVKLVATTNNLCKDSVSKKVYLLNNANVDFNINNFSQCLNQNKFRFTDLTSVAKGSLIYNWNFGDNNTSSSISPTHSYTNIGNKTVKLVVTANSICIDSIEKNVTLLASPKSIIQINNDKQCFEGNNFNFNQIGNVASGSLNTIWQLGDMQSKMGNNISHNYSNAGSFNVKSIAISDDNCQDTANILIRVFAMPKADFNINKDKQCFDNQNFVITDISVSSNVYNRIWKVDNTNLSNINSNINQTFSAIGNYQIQLLTVTNNGCRDSLSKPVEVLENPDFNIIGKEKFCLNDLMTLEALPSTHFYEWSVQGYPKITTNQWNQNAKQTGIKNVVVKAISANGCITEKTFTDRLKIFDLPKAEIDTQIITQINGLDFVLRDVSQTVVSQRNWNFSAPFFPSNNQNVTLFINDSATISAQLTITDTNGCIGTTQKTYFIVLPNSFYFPNAFSPNKDGKNEEFGITGFAKVKTFKMVIYNRWGEKVFESNDPSVKWDGKYQDELVPEGTYYYSFEILDLSGNNHFKRGSLTILR